MDLNNILAPSRVPDWRPDPNLQTPFRSDNPLVDSPQSSSQPNILPLIEEALTFSSSITRNAPVTISPLKLQNPQTAESELLGYLLIKLKRIESYSITAEQSLSKDKNSLRSYRKLLSLNLLEAFRLVQSLFKKRESRKEEKSVETTKKNPEEVSTPQNISPRGLLFLTFTSLITKIPLENEPLVIDSEILQKAAQLELIAERAIDLFNTLSYSINDVILLEQMAEGVGFAVSESNKAILELSARSIREQASFRESLNLVERTLSVIDRYEDLENFSFSRMILNLGE